MPVRSRVHNPHPPLRRVVDFYDEGSVRMNVLSCGHKLPEEQSHPKKLNSHARCALCAAAGDFDVLPCDSERAGKPRFCTRCGCRLRKGQRNDVCDPCNKFGGPVR
jgi:hypothetical protein